MRSKVEVRTSAPPLTPAELLQAVDHWLINQAGRAAARLGLDMQELLQEFRVKVFLLAGGYDPARGKPTTWATTTVIRAVIGRVCEGRSRRVRPRAFSQFEGADLALRHYEDERVPRPEALAAAADERAAVRAMVAGLGGLAARAVALRFGIGEPAEVTGEELGRRLGVSRQAAVELVRDGLEALRVKAGTRSLAAVAG